MKPKAPAGNRGHSSIFCAAGAFSLQRQYTTNRPPTQPLDVISQTRWHDDND